MTSNVTDWAKFPGLPFALPFEERFQPEPWRIWFIKYWPVSIFFALGYVIFVHLSTNFMKNRQPYNLRTPLTIWSGALCLFSLYGAVRLLPELWDIFSTKGIHESICESRYMRDKRLELAILLFVWSKVFELIDTAFIIFRKQKLIFLHWYHHWATLVYAFFGFREFSSPYLWFSSMNYSIHFVMYGFYSLRAAQIRVPRVFAVSITTAQIAQMIMGVYVNYYAIAVKVRGQRCDVTYEPLLLGLATYVSFLILFANFFVRAYLTKSARPVENKKKQ